MISYDAPTAGWDAFSSLDQMAPNAAIELINWIPEAGYVRSRGGYSSHGTGLGDEVETLAVFNDGASSKLIAGANSNLWDVTSAGAGSSIGSGYTNDRWQTITSHGRLLLVNGADTPLEYDGTTLSTMTITGSGLTSSDLIGLMTHKGRVFYFEDDAQSFWYCAASSYKGAVSEFNLGPFVSRGGKLIQMFSWSLDGGAGSDDVAVFVFSSGEVLIYQGSDPGNANDWYLQGRYQMGEPLGKRGFARFGADVIMATKDGYDTINDGRGRAQGQIPEFSARIIRAAKEAAQIYGDNFGWQVTYYPKGNLIIFNVPVAEGKTYEQHVMNTNTQAWCRFQNLPARCWVVFNDQLYFGGDEVVYLADTGTSDGGSSITCTCQTPFFHYQNNQARKRVSAVNVVSTFQSPSFMTIDVATDYQTPDLSSLAEPPLDESSAWDTSDWDVATWGNEVGRVVTAWRMVSGQFGQAHSLNIRLQTTSEQIRWYSTELQFETGGPF